MPASSVLRHLWRKNKNPLKEDIDTLYFICLKLVYTNYFLSTHSVYWIHNCFSSITVVLIYKNSSRVFWAANHDSIFASNVRFKIKFKENLRTGVWRGDVGNVQALQFKKAILRKIKKLFWDFLLVLEIEKKVNKKKLKDFLFPPPTHIDTLFPQVSSVGKHSRRSLWDLRISPSLRIMALNYSNLHLYWSVKSTLLSEIKMVTWCYLMGFCFSCEKA